MELHHSTPTIEQPATAFYTTTTSQGRSGFCGRSNSRGRGRGRQNARGSSSNAANNSPSGKPTSSPSCQICNRVGHSALDCFHRLDLFFQGRQPPEKLQAMVASKQGTSTWFTDTGAMNHLMPDLGNMSIHTDYVGTNNLVVGNGKGLPISHVGSSHCLSYGTHLSLQNILLVPHVSHNLLSVSQFTKDNDCSFIFTSSGFYVKANKSGKILYQGRISNGLYPLHLPLVRPNSLPTSPSAFSCIRASILLWHHRLGHTSSQVFKAIASSLPLCGTSSLLLCALLVN